jgi:hypothetical protein
MEITIDELLKGKATKIKEKAFYQTEAYVTPFLDRMQKITNDFKVKVELPDQITVTQKDDVDFDDITYNRVWIQGVLPQEYDIENHQDVIGMVYGLDVRKPIVKFYRGGLNRACCNLCVFNPSFLSCQDIYPEAPIDYVPVDDLIRKASELKQWLNTLHSTTFERSEQNINESLGLWVRRCLSVVYSNGFGKVKLAVSTAVDAYKLLFEDGESPYYVHQGEHTDMFNVYNAFTDIISNDKDKDIINKAEKCLLLKKILF